MNNTHTIYFFPANIGISFQATLFKFIESTYKYNMYTV